MSLTLFVIILLALPCVVNGQTPVPITDKVQKDNIVADTPQQAVSAHSANTALWKSAVIPGWGQIYNRQAWKVGIIYGGAAVATYFGVTNYRNAQKFKTEYINRNEGNTTDLLPDYASYPDENIYNLYQAYEKNFQLSIIAGVAIYALNLIDAYCYGHLFDFQINDDLSLRLIPTVETYNIGMGFASGMKLQINF
ncbi:MAG: hypothetical protein IKJ67_07255 [Bacteroidales bacterium]|nr:hypothetical protein [Bacteroidales bacterium]